MDLSYKFLMQGTNNQLMFLMQLHQSVTRLPSYTNTQIWAKLPKGKRNLTNMFSCKINFGPKKMLDDRKKYIGF